MLIPGNLALFEIDVTYEAESRMRDEFGWVEGSGPGNGRYQPVTDTLRIVTTGEKLAEAWAQKWLSGDGIRNMELKDTRRVRIDRLLLEFQP